MTPNDATSIMSSAIQLAQHATGEADRVQAAITLLRDGKTLPVRENIRLLEGMQQFYRRSAGHALLTATLICQNSGIGTSLPLGAPLIDWPNDTEAETPSPAPPTRRPWWRFW